MAPRACPSDLLGRRQRLADAANPAGAGCAGPSLLAPHLRGEVFSAAWWTSPRRRPPMEQSDAERQLVGLLRGLDVPEFSLYLGQGEALRSTVGGGPRMASAGEPDVDRDHGHSAGGRPANHDERRTLRAPGSSRSCGGAPPQKLRRPGGRLPPGDGADSIERAESLRLSAV
jgi:hypothetical protein